MAGNCKPRKEEKAKNVLNCKEIYILKIENDKLNLLSDQFISNT